MNTPAPVFDSQGNPAELRDGETYIVCATVPTGEQLSDSGVSAAEVRAALVNAERLGITIDRIIEEGPLMSESEMINAFRLGQ